MSTLFVGVSPFAYEMWVNTIRFPSANRTRGVEVADPHVYYPDKMGQAQVGFIPEILNRFEIPSNYF